MLKTLDTIKIILLLIIPNKRCNIYVLILRKKR